MTTRLTPPEPVDLVPASSVAQIIVETDRELTELEQRWQASEAEADAAEAWFREAGIEEEVSTWVMIRLERFLAGLREEAERDAQNIVDLARHRSALRVAEAQAEVNRATARDDASWPWRDGKSLGTISSSTRPLEHHPLRWSPTDSERAPMAADWVAPAAGAAGAAEPQIGGAEHERPEAATVAPPVVAAPPAFVTPEIAHAVSEPAGVASNGFAPDVIDLAALEPSQDATLTRLASPPTVAPVAGVETDASPGSEPEVIDAHGVGEGEFWQTEKAAEKAPRRHRFPRLPLSAILEVIAVVLILVFILLRLS